MFLELKVLFMTPDRFVVQYDDRETESLAFMLPLVQGDRDDIRWYLETYGASYTSEPDDLRAQGIEAKLLEWGKALFEATLGKESSFRLFRAFEAANAECKLLTITSNQPEILSLPWELISDGRDAPFLLRVPTIGVRRCLDQNLDEFNGNTIQPRQHLHMLYLTSRPEGTGFIDPRVEAIPVLEAIEREAIDVINIEFLRPATMENLSDRLACTGDHQAKLPVDILHFDGHGSFYPDKQQGFLAFEDVGCKLDSVPAEKIGQLLKKHQVGLVVLSACQSAQVAGEDPMGSVAVQLNAAGVPAVLAMSYSILVESARRLFGAFYRNLLTGQGVGASLNGARMTLFRDRARGERQRWQKRIVLELQDWFLPALYQAGNDAPLLLPQDTIDTPAPTEAIPKIQEFIGRAWELWHVEREFVRGRRRITISGFGGQGKTALALEACLWLIRTGMFANAGFVSFTGFQNLETADALRYTVAVLGQELGESFLDTEAVRGYLQNTPTLIVLDNLEILGDEELTELLDAAVGWSESGDSKVLLTTRSPRLSHADYPLNERVHPHYAMRLDGWREEDAVSYFQQALQPLSSSSFQLPTREDLVAIFSKVDFQPLAVRLLAELIKNKPCTELGKALDELLCQEDSADSDRNLKASLNLSLQRLDPALQDWLPRLGVFQGGAMENVLLTVMALSETDEDLEVALARELFIAIQQNDTKVMRRVVGLIMNLETLRNNLELPAEIEQVPRQDYQEMKNKLEAILAEIPEKDLTEGITSVTWQQIRHELESSGLIQTEYLSGNDSPYIKFYPTLAPVLWERLAADIRKAVTARYQEIYYILSQELNSEDRNNAPFARNLALRELPNLLFAVRNAIKNPSTDTPKFVNTVDYFLTIFGMRRDRDDLTEQTTTLVGEVGSQLWYLIRSNEARQLIDAGYANEAIPLFEEILKALGEKPSHERSVTLCNLGRCYRFLGQLDRAEIFCQKGLTVVEILIETDPENRRNHQQQKEALLGDLANIFMDDGRYREARKVCEVAQAINLEFENDSSAAVNNLRLGTLALREGNLTESIERYLVSIAAFEKLKEPQQTAVGYYQLGYAYAEANALEEAEKAYRTSAEIKASQGMIFGDNGAAATWNQLGLVCRIQGKLDSAEDWHRKALEIFQQSNDPVRISVILSNLASLLVEQPHRLADARLFAERSLAVKRNLDHNATEIWKTYQILAEIATQQGQVEAARTYRRQMRQSYNAFSGAQHQLQQFDVLISSVVASTQAPNIRQQLEVVLALVQEAEPSRQNLVVATRQLLNGERDEDTLCTSLGNKDSAIICFILRSLSDPSTNPIRQLLQIPSIQALIAQLSQNPEGQALLQAIEVGNETALQQFLTLLSGKEAH